MCVFLKRCEIGLAVVAMVWLLSSGLAAKSKDTAQASGASQATSADEAGRTYVGSQTCQGCHDQLYTGFQATPHWQTMQKTKMSPGGHGCESCHGPGSAHVEGGGDKTKIFTFKNVSVKDSNQRCLTCHQQDQERGQWSRGPHATNGVTCIGCHSPHFPKEHNALLIDNSPQLCYRCHQEQKADFTKPFRHRVNEGLVQCEDCHNPHGGTPLRRGLRQVASQEEACFKCHRDKQGPFLYEHVPVKVEGCSSCHVPHGSVNARLLRVTPVNVLCLQCHTPAPNSATPALPSFHNQTQKYQACTLCHPAIHGSNATETLEF